MHAWGAYPCLSPCRVVFAYAFNLIRRSFLPTRSVFCLSLLAFSLSLSHAVLDRPAESSGEPSSSYRTGTGPFPDLADPSRAYSGAVQNFQQQTQLPLGEWRRGRREEDGGVSVIELLVCECTGFLAACSKCQSSRPAPGQQSQPAF